ncbi:MAG: carboxymuconolactone decarboxylase family protein [Actinobacteria bacterium]|nr:carboxymuconolactone decarboxylase family protein [Actinomycetota bacterium]
MWVRMGQRGSSLPGVLASHSLNEAALDAHLGLYRTVMFGQSPLTRAEREAIAVIVSAANDCHY